MSSYTTPGAILFRYIPGVGRVAATACQSSAFLSGLGNVLIVDSVYGNDSTGAPSGAPYKTVSAALTAASAGQTVWVMPGTYNETIDIKTGVALRGLNVQTTTIQKLGVVADTTLCTMRSQTRVEDITFTLTSAANVNLTGINSLAPGTSIDSKLRTAVVNVTSTATGAGNIYGILSSSSPGSANVFNASYAVRGSTIKVQGNGTGVIRGILVNGANRFSIRDTVVYAGGAGANVTGIETSVVGAFAEIKTSSLYGLSSGADVSTSYDLNRSAGDIQLSATDLVNANSNGNSFSTLTEPAGLQFSVSGNINSRTTHYLLPGTSTYASLETTAVGIPFIQKLIVFQLFLSAAEPILGDAAITLNFYKNTVSIGTLFLTGTINSTTQTVRSLLSSANFAIGDKLIAQFVTSGTTNVGLIPIFASASLY